MYPLGKDPGLRRSSGPDVRAEAAVSHSASRQVIRSAFMLSEAVWCRHRRASRKSGSAPRSQLQLWQITAFKGWASCRVYREQLLTLSWPPTIHLQKERNTHMHAHGARHHISKHLFSSEMSLKHDQEGADTAERAEKMKVDNIKEWECFVWRKIWCPAETLSEIIHNQTFPPFVSDFLSSSSRVEMVTDVNHQPVLLTDRSPVCLFTQTD